MTLLLILYLLAHKASSCSNEPNYQPRWANPSKLQELPEAPKDIKPFVPPVIDTKLPVFRRMDALTLSSNPNAPREETPTPKQKEKESKQANQRK